MNLQLTVNGRGWAGEVEPRLSLADLLRERMRLTGTHLGCEQGACGACTVLLDGEAVRSCLLLAVQAAGRAVTTVEGIDLDLGPVFQYGFCRPGFVVTAEGRVCLVLNTIHLVGRWWRAHVPAGDSPDDYVVNTGTTLGVELNFDFL